MVELCKWWNSVQNSTIVGRIPKTGILYMNLNIALSYVNERKYQENNSCLLAW